MEIENMSIYIAEPLEMEQLTLINSRLYLNGKAVIDNLTLTENSIVFPYPPDIQGKIRLEITQDLIIHQGSCIETSSKGFAGGHQGPGKTLDNVDGSIFYAGGSHGGPGGADDNSSPNQPYGNVYFPSNAGSGGGANTDSSSCYGGNGGGVVKITVNGTLTLDGIIAANGQPSPFHGGGGSGGSIWIDAYTITGTGTIEAKGGEALNEGCGGGGGRIALYYNDALTNGQFDPSQIYCQGGQGSDGTYPSGGGGTIYLKDKSLLLGDLIIDNEQISGGVRPTILTVTGIGPGNNTDLSSGQLFDDCADFPVPVIAGGLPGLKGYWVNPDVLQSKTFRIIDNTTTCLITDPDDGDMTKVAHSGSHYIGAYVFQDITLKNADLFCRDYLDIKGNITATDGEIITDSDFYLDFTPPAPPYVYPIASPALEQVIIIDGIKDPGVKVYRNCKCIVGATSDVFWQISYTLKEGINILSFTQKDEGGNHSQAVVKTVVYDEIPPLEIAPTADGRGDGSFIVLSWQNYDELSDLGYYKIYQSDNPFTDISAEGVILLGTTDRGVKTYTAKGLTQGSTYYFAVTGVDNKNNENQTITEAVSAIPEDAMAPQDVPHLEVTECTAESIAVSWTPSLNTTGDLDHQSIHINGDVERHPACLSGA